MKISLDEALSLIHKNIKSKEPERISLWESPGRTAAEAVFSQTDNPPFDRSPYDGYALKASDTAHGQPLEVIGESFAGTPSDKIIKIGQAVRIMTGGAIPDGADCIVPQEQTDINDGYVTVKKPYSAYDNYIRRGEDFRRGDMLIAGGTKINAAYAALAAAGGNRDILVYPKIRAAVISTGDELKAEGEKLEYGQIYDTNLIYVSMRLEELGVETVIRKRAGDDIESIKAAVEEACLSADIVITTGGVSVGEKDLIPKAVEAAGGKIIFHGVAVKPGMPTMFAMSKNGVPIAGLSGNPFAAAVGFEVLIRPMLASLSGDRQYECRRKEAVLLNGFAKSSASMRFVKAVERGGKVYIPEAQGNGSVRSTAECNCYIEVPQNSGELKTGDRAVILCL